MLETSRESSFCGRIDTRHWENIPLANQSVDMVVSTFTLCTVPSPITVLHNIQKVLKPNGKFIFCEHGQAPDAKVQCWQKYIESAQPKICRRLQS